MLELSGLRALVTGGAGFIGSHLVDACLAAGMTVRVLDCLMEASHGAGADWPEYLPESVEKMYGSVAVREDVFKALTNIDVVFHMSSIGGLVEGSVFMHENATGMALMFDVIAQHKLPIKKIVVASSQGIYGEGRYASPDGTEFSLAGTGEVGMRKEADLDNGMWEVRCPKTGEPTTGACVPECQTPMPASPYAISKMAVEQLALVMGRAQGIPTVALRFGLTYGPRQSVKNAYSGIVSIFSTMILNGKNPIIYEDGLQTRDFTFVADNVAAQLLVMRDPRANYQVFNVSTGVATTLNEVVEILANEYGRPELTGSRPGKYRLIDARHLVLDSSRLRALGWAPQYTAAMGLKAQATWIKTLGEVKDYFSDTMTKQEGASFVRGSKA